MYFPQVAIKMRFWYEVGFCTFFPISQLCEGGSEGVKSLSLGREGEDKSTQTGHEANTPHKSYEILAPRNRPLAVRKSVWDSRKVETEGNDGGFHANEPAPLRARGPG